MRDCDVNDSGGRSQLREVGGGQAPAPRDCVPTRPPAARGIHSPRASLLCDRLRERWRPVSRC